MRLTDDEWKKKLSPDQYRVLRQKGTEIPGTGKFLDNTTQGDYLCAACGQTVFRSDTKYDSTTPGLIGWPSFSEAAEDNAIKLQDDDSMGMHRQEVTCAKCGSHLGHLFPDDSSSSGKHFCINSAALEFMKQNSEEK